ncbi:MULTISPECIES: flagellin [Stappiaceae]|jgi:flagellin|uniref:flagellin N-terminal helical domain-containing protein n=1 Tax=Stappiaceae TaxID=2821832 RepID=UPI000926BFB4|nr:MULTISPECIES: flagellin [Stappiaceae]MBO9426827.1 flagellin [Labrenzia sp. R4_1]OJJ12089.1 flagellin [Alphaproteobacteria bacterium AO1-B]
MSSLLTNASAMTALQTLSMTNKDLATTQNRISTGQRVATASDNAAYWSIATTMRSDNKSLSAVEDALGLGAATVDTMYTALESTVDKLSEMRALLVTASTPGTDPSKTQENITALQNTLTQSVDSAVFNGQNWLKTDSTVATTAAEIVSSFTRDSSGAISILKTDVTLANIRLVDSSTARSGVLDQDRSTLVATAVTGTLTGDSILTWDVSGLDAVDDTATFESLIAQVDDALQSVTSSAAFLGAIKTRVDLQKDFVSNLTDAIDRGIGQLVDADMNAESTRLQALQTQQQLGIQALSIANQGSQNILSLFR